MGRDPVLKCAKHCEGSTPVPLHPLSFLPYGETKSAEQKPFELHTELSEIERRVERICDRNILTCIEPETPLERLHGHTATSPWEGLAKETGEGYSVVGPRSHSTSRDTTSPGKERGGDKQDKQIDRCSQSGRSVANNTTP